MFDTLAGAMRGHPAVKLTKAPRLADFAHWGVAISEVKGYKAEDFLTAYGANVESQNEAALEDSLVAQAILGFIQMGQEWTGTASQLLEVLTSRAEILRINVKDRSWPKAPNALSKRLHEVAPNLRRVGIEVSEGRPGGTKTWTLHRQPGEKTAHTGHTAKFEPGPGAREEDSTSPNEDVTSTPGASSSTPGLPRSKAKYGDGVDDVGLSSTLAGSPVGVSSEDADEGVV